MSQTANTPAATDTIKKAIDIVQTHAARSQPGLSGTRSRH